MKLFFSILLFFPTIAMGQTYSSGDDLFINDNRVVETNFGDSGQVGLTSGYDTDDDESIVDEASDLGASGGFNVTTQGGLDGTTDGQNKGSSVQILGVAMGVAFAVKCATPFNQWACPIAAMSFKDALSGSSARQAAFQTASYMDPSLGSNGTSNDNYTILDQQAADGLQNLADMGYTVNADGSVTTPEGETFTADDYASANNLAKKGLDQNAANKAMDGLSKIKDDAAQKAGVSLEDEGQQIANAGSSSGSGGYSDSSPVGSDLIIEDIEYRDKKKKEKHRLPANAAAKLSKNFNGEPIGIGAANLFLIVHQKYNEKKKDKNVFIMKEY